MKCGVWRVQCEVWGVKSAVWSVECEVWSVDCEVWSVKCEVWTVKCEVWSVKCEVWSVQWEACSVSVECEVWSVKCEVWSAQCAECSVKSAVCSVECEDCQVWSVTWSFKCDMWNKTPVSQSARTHGLRWGTAHASSIDEKGLIYISLRQLPPRLVRVLLVHLSIIYPWLLAIFHDWPLLTLINHWVHVLITDSLTLLKDCRSLNESPTGPLRSGPGEETEKPGYGSEFPPAEGKSCSIWANYDYGEMTATTTTSPSCLWVRQFTSTNGWNLTVCFFAQMLKS